MFLYVVFSDNPQLPKAYKSRLNKDKSNYVALMDEWEASDSFTMTQFFNAAEAAFNEANLSGVTGGWGYIDDGCGVRIEIECKYKDLLKVREIIWNVPTDLELMEGWYKPEGEAFSVDGVE